MGDGFTVPTDWTEEDGYALGVVCFPNSLQWRINVQSAIYLLTRARGYDFSTGYWKGIENQAIDVWESFMSCDFQTLIDLGEQHIKTQRMIVAALMGQSINFDSEPLPNAINYENGIRQAILSVGGAIGSDMTLAELVAAMEASDGPDYGFKDWLEILRLFQEIFNGAGLVSVGAISGLIGAIFAARTSHNTLAIQAMQATALRGIQNAIAPPKDPPTEEATVSSWMDTLEKIPFLTTAIVAIVDPSPAGEGAMAAKFALTVKQLSEKAFGWLSDWWNNYVSTVANPQPAGTVVGMLSEISRKIQSLSDEQETPSVTVSNRLKLIADSIDGIDTNGEDITPTLQEIVTALNGIALPDGVTWQGLFDQLTNTMGETVPIINVTCSSCGGSAGCGCGGSGGSEGGASGGVNSGIDKPPIEVVSGTYPPSFPSQEVFNVYKCKAANVIVLNLAEVLAQLAEQETTNLSQYETRTQAGVQLGVSITAVIYSAGLLAAFANYAVEHIIDYLWPYPNEDSIALAIFEGIRLDLLSDRENAVCILYTSEDTGEARTGLQDLMDGYINATSYTSDVKTMASEMIANLLSNQFLNRLFQKDSAINVYSDASSVDCSVCEIIADCQSGEDIAGNEQEFDISSIPAEGGFLVSAGWTIAKDITVTLLEGTPATPTTQGTCVTRISSSGLICGAACNNGGWDRGWGTFEFGEHLNVCTIMYRSANSIRIRITVNS